MPVAQDTASRLQASPTRDELIDALSGFRASVSPAGAPSSQTLEVYATIFTSALIPLFISDPKAVHEFVLVFSSVSGLGALVSRLSQAPQHEVDALITVLERVLEQPGIVATLVHSQQREAANLIVGSRILAAASSKLTESWTGDALRYTSWLAQQLATTDALEADAGLFDRAAKLGAPTVLLRTFLQNEHFGTLQALWPRLRKTQQRFLLSQALVPVLPESPAQSGRILLDLGVDAELMYDLCLRSAVGLATLRAAVVLARESGKLKSLTLRLVRDWSNKISFECSSLMSKQTHTQLIIASCASLAPADAASISHSPDLLDGVSLYLSSTSPNIRKIGTLVAETFAKQAGQKLEFGIKYDEYEWWLGFDSIDPTRQPQLDHLHAILNPSTTEVPDEAKPKADSDDDDADYDDDADSEEEITPPFYIKDLVAYLQSDKYGEVYSGLSMGASLIARKSRFGSEVSQYAPDLLRVACSLSDKFSITKFSELRQSILNAVIVADPKQAPTIVSMFSLGDWSLAQRQSLLAALAYGAHELSQGLNRVEFEQLPPALHKLFISNEDKSRFAITGHAGTRNITNERKDETALAAGDSKGTVLRRSQRLDRAPGTSSTSIQKNLFSPVSHMFFFPLVAAAPPLRPSSYDALIYAQWLRTLGVIVVEAYPTKHMPDMVSELWPVLTGLVGRNTHEVVIEEALYTCLLMVITVAGGIVIQDHASDIGVLLDKISVRVQTASEPRTQQVAAAAGAKLAEMARAVEQRLFGSTATA